MRGRSWFPAAQRTTRGRFFRRQQGERLKNRPLCRQRPATHRPFGSGPPTISFFRHTPICGIPPALPIFIPPPRTIVRAAQRGSGPMFRIFCHTVCQGQKIQKHRIQQMQGICWWANPPRSAHCPLPIAPTQKSRRGFPVLQPGGPRRPFVQFASLNRGRHAVRQCLPLSSSASPLRGCLHRFLRAVFRPARAAYTNSETIKSRMMMVTPITAVMPVWHL